MQGIFDITRLIVKGPYIKCVGDNGTSGYLKYIATRERVQIIADNRPPTRKQEQFITKLVRDFPSVKGLPEHEELHGVFYQGQSL